MDNHAILSSSAMMQNPVKSFTLMTYMPYSIIQIRNIKNIESTKRNNIMTL